MTLSNSQIFCVNNRENEGLALKHNLEAQELCPKIRGFDPLIPIFLFAHSADPQGKQPAFTAGTKLWLKKSGP